MNRSLCIAIIGQPIGNTLNSNANRRKDQRNINNNKKTTTV